MCHRRFVRGSVCAAVSFSVDDLAALGHLVVVGQAVLQKHPPVVARLKAAMTPMGVPFPEGL